MYKIKKLIWVVIPFVLFISSSLCTQVEACKDIIVTGDATDGEYNLLLKVRDPSRDGLQVLCIVPEGYEYTYHHPWTGKAMSFNTKYKHIGVASQGDTIPNIVKSGMSFSTAGIAYGDADSDSSWKNPTKYGWDDFDWIRYACEKAETEDEAVRLMTQDVVKQMHASAVSENLFIVGPNKGFVIEADSIHFDVKEINNGIVVMHNYPIELWDTQYFKTRLISKSFDTTKEKYVRDKEVVRLGSIYGVKIVEIGNDFISVKPTGLVHSISTRNIGVKTKINLGESKTVGKFYVELLEIDGKKAKVSVKNIYKAWEDKMLEYIQPKYGEINVKDMIHWSRLGEDDLDDLRSMCQHGREYEAVMIYKIPEINYETYSIGWFSANHACSSIYVPVHISVNDIYDPYETGEAAQLYLDLLNEYEHGQLIPSFSNVESVFFNETDFAEEIALDFIKEGKKISDFFTIIDTSMQKQAFLFSEIYIEVSKISNEKTKQKIIDMMTDLWSKNYSFSLNNMKKAVFDLENIPESDVICEKINDIALDICKSRIDVLNVVGKQSKNAEDNYLEGSRLIRKRNYEAGYEYIQQSFTECNMIFSGQTFERQEDKDLEKIGNSNILQFFTVVILLLLAILVILVIKRK